MNTETIQHLKLTNIKPSRTNPRQHLDETRLKELADNIAALGVLQPIIVRPSNGAHEIVAGERRWRASQLAKRDTIPVIVRQLTDQQAQEIQLIENLQREDLDELEEAEGYQRLIREHRYTADQIAEKIHKGRSYVYGRLKLLALPEFAKQAVREKQINASIGLLLARIPNPALQKQAAAEILKSRSEPMSERQASEWIQERYMIRLKGAPFDPENAKLVPSAGACSKCPKRTGNLKHLFPDIKATDVCTDPKCFQAKKEAAWKAQATAAKEKGLKVLSPDEYDRTRYSAEYVRLDEHIGLSDPRPWKKVLGEHCPTLTITQDNRTGETVRLIKREEALKIAKDHKLIKPAADPWQDKQRAQEQKRKLARKATALVLAQLTDKFVTAPVDHNFWQVLAAFTIKFLNYHDGQQLIKQGIIPAPKESWQWQEVVQRYAADLDAKKLRRFVSALLLQKLIGDGVDHDGSFLPEFKAVARAYGFDVEQVLKGVNQSAKAESKTPKKQKK